MKLEDRRKKCPNCFRKTFFTDDLGEWECSYCHYKESTIVTLMLKMSKASDIGDWETYNNTKTELNNTIIKNLEQHQKQFKNEGIYP